MNDASEKRGQTASRRAASQTTDLVNLAAPVFDLILRLKAGIVQPSNTLRPQIAEMLRKFEERAERYRFNLKLVVQAKFALAAFVDETVLTNNFPLKEEWEKYPLQLEYFGEQMAGIKFFERLDNLIRQIQYTADAVEVYYMCLLLGYKGKYAVYMEHELVTVIQDTAKVLNSAGRLLNPELSPHWLVQDQPEPPKKYPFLPGWAKLLAASGLVLAVLIYLGMFVASSRFLNTALEKLLI